MNVKFVNSSFTKNYCKIAGAMSDMALVQPKPMMTLQHHFFLLASHELENDEKFVPEQNMSILGFQFPLRSLEAKT